MSANQLRVLGIALCYLVIFVSGFRLSRAGKPYSGVIATIHKLVALAAVVLFIIILYQANLSAPLTAMGWGLCILDGLFLLGLFVTGALLSITKPMPGIVRTLHHLVPYLVVLLTAVIFFFLI